MKDILKFTDESAVDSHVRILFGVCSCGKVHGQFKAEAVENDKPAPVDRQKLRLKAGDATYNAVFPK